MLNSTNTCLVTGGCGFIGSNLLPLLLERGVTVRVLDNMSTGSRTLCAKLDIQIIEGDIRDAALVANAMAGVDTVIHLAASGSVVESVAEPAANFDINVGGTFNVLEQARRSGVRRVAYASTGGALIGDATPPVNEDSLPKPISPYGASKLCGEAYCHAFAKAYSLQTVTLRFANVYGPNSSHKKGVVTRFAKALLRDEPFVIYGDGKASRDFIYVSDLCAGLLKAIEADFSPGEVFHIASGVETRIETLANTLLDVVGKPGHPIEYKPKREAEVSRNFASYRKAYERFDYEPSQSLREGLLETWHWFLAQGAAAFGT